MPQGGRSLASSITQERFGAKRHIFEDKGGEADQIAEPPASGQKTVHKIDTA
jgi:hypothetical protein